MRCKFNSTKCNSNQTWNNDKCQFEFKTLKEHQKDYEKDHIQNSVTCTCGSHKYSGNITGDSVIKSDEIIKLTKTIPPKSPSTNFSINSTFY